MAKFGLPGSPEPEWDGPIDLTVVLCPKQHGKVAQYRGRFNGQSSRYYAPLFLLHNLKPDEVPPNLLLRIARSREANWTLGFNSQCRKLRREPAAYECEQHVYADPTDKPANSVRDDYAYDGQTYGLYVPNVVFGDPLHPKGVPPRLLVVIGVPAD